MFKKIVFSLIALFFTASCSDTWSSVKRGLTGAKSNSTDEFLVEKKDPLVLPPNFENLPQPSQASENEEEIEDFQKKLEGLSAETTETDNSQSSKGSEQSILEQIRKQ